MKKVELIPGRPETKELDDVLDIAAHVPWNEKDWTVALTRLFEWDFKRGIRPTKGWALSEFATICTVPFDLLPGERRGIPVEAVWCVAAELLRRCEYPSVMALCADLFAEDRAFATCLDVADVEKIPPALVGTMLDNCVFPQHLKTLYSVAGRPPLCHRHIVHYVSHELGVLRYGVLVDCEGQEPCPPLDYVRNVFNQNLRKYIDRMISVDTFGEDRVREALSLCHESSPPECWKTLEGEQLPDETEPME